MEGILFLYNIVLIIFCAASATTAALTYQKTKKNIFLYLAALPVCYIVEFIVLHYISSAMYFSGQAVDSAALNHISFVPVRILSYLAILLLDLLVLLWILQIPWKSRYLLSLLPAVVFYILLAFPAQSNLVVWLFYSIRQFYRFAFLLLFTYRYFSTADEARHSYFKQFAPFMTGILFLNCSVLIEDSLMISHLGSVLFDTPWMSERNFSENLLWIFICCCSLHICRQKLLAPASAPNALDGYGPNDSFVPTSVNDSKTAISEPGDNAAADNVNNTNNADNAANPLINNLPSFVEYYKLTPRESEILRCLINCQQTSEICEELNISIGTVKTHIHNIYMKLEINTRAELIRQLSEFNQ